MSDTHEAGSSPSRGRGIGSIPITANRSAPKRDITEGLTANPISTLAVPAEDEEIAAIKDVRYIGSYNWMDNPSPTILVPGSPRIWRNKPVPFTVPADSGYQFCDQNGYRLPSTPLLPILVAVDSVASESDPSSTTIDWPSIDFIIDRNGLRKLMGWVTERKQKFRIDLQLAGEKTVLCNRWEAKTRMKTFGGYGYAFENAVTRPAPGCETDAGGHHRIITYDFNGLKMVVRFEVDACLVPEDPPPVSVDTLSAEVASKATLSERPESTRAVEGMVSLTVVAAGKPIANECTVELATRKAGNSLLWREKYLQMYFSQTPELFIGKQKDGCFTDIQRKTIESLSYVGDNVQKRLRVLRKALHDIQALVSKFGSTGRLSLIGRDKDLLVFERSTSDSCLPDEYLKRFKRGG
ncbi:uncharacterized protein EV420DRAFT_1711802 [Desarmillaria tabescens]|uniref:Geranylgeranyl pyrophosphate synthetase n=1 Tax=Armillaria tabescens TaxID=1929756 RepID=A0AA39JTF3_ARMTA|nr:uncharacterized protein EV420DRAFT_1711802 [Desarmillaria tabescens]KAK0448469.1 hypothetical protein EV420DRAFT_1711802 [Desarmillaria tabescens]